MDNSETLATLGIQDTEWRQIKHNNTTHLRELKKMGNTDPTTNFTMTISCDDETIPPVSITSHINSKQQQKTTTYDIENSAPGLGQEQKCGRDKPLTVIGSNVHTPSDNSISNDNTDMNKQ